MPARHTTELVFQAQLFSENGYPFLHVDLSIYRFELQFRTAKQRVTSSRSFDMTGRPYNPVRGLTGAASSLISAVLILTTKSSAW